MRFEYAFETYCLNKSKSLYINCKNDSESQERNCSEKFFWTLLSCIRTQYRDLLSKFLYSGRRWKDTEQKICEYGYYLSNEDFGLNFYYGMKAFIVSLRSKSDVVYLLATYVSDQWNDIMSVNSPFNRYQENSLNLSKRKQKL